jgi:predicted Zn finger-like uncharacterized protein
MPEIINCPQCERKLRVPDNLLGQPVKCPTCGTTFTAAAAPVEAPPSPAPAPPPPPPPPQEQPYVLEYDNPPSPAAQPPYQSPYYRPQGRAPDFDDPLERRRHLRPAAMDAIAGPAIALLIVGIIGIVGSALGVCAGFMVSANAPAGRRQMNNEAEPYVVLCFYGVMLITSIVVVVCATKMRRLESYGAAMTGAILAVIPCLSPCFLLGIPFGIWALVVLNQGDVKDAFYR